MATLLNVTPDAAALAAATAERIATLLRHVIERHGDARLCLTGGDTPRETYRTLARPPFATGVPWEQVEFFWGDERHVPPDHPDSNFGMAREALLRPLAIADRQQQRMRAELPSAAAAAAEYDSLLRDRAARGRPRFDVMLLGLGADAHIASLFPGSDWLRAPGLGVRGTGSEEVRPQVGVDTPREPGPSSLAAAVRKPDDGRWRITLTPAALLDAAAILVITAGAQKADAVFAALRGPADPFRWPAQLLREAEAVEWWMDREAARLVSA